LFKSLI